MELALYLNDLSQSKDFNEIISQLFLWLQELDLHEQFGSPSIFYLNLIKYFFAEKWLHMTKL